MITLEDVAKVAQVSVATVSRVVNKSSLVTQETTKKVNEIIDRLNYSPNLFGRSLRCKDSQIILIVIPNITNPYYSSIVSGIESVFFRENFITMLCVTESSQYKISRFIGFLKSGTAKAAVILSVEKTDKEISSLAHNYTIVQCSEYSNDSSVAHVSIDNLRAATHVTEYLISLGHRNISLISASNQFISTELRQCGYFTAMKAAGICDAYQNVVYADGNYSFSSGVRAMEDLLTKKDRPTAIFCVSDIIALGAINKINEVGLRVPEDITVVGFDNVEYATMFTPRLTTVLQPCYELGVKSAELTLDLLAGGEKGGGVFIDYELVIRESATSPKSLQRA